MFTLHNYDLSIEHHFQEFISTCMYAIFRCDNEQIRDLLLLDEDVDDIDIDEFKENAREIWENPEYLKYDRPF